MYSSVDRRTFALVFPLSFQEQGADRSMDVPESSFTMKKSPSSRKSCAFRTSGWALTIRTYESIATSVSPLAIAIERTKGLRGSRAYQIVTQVYLEMIRDRLDWAEMFVKERGAYTSKGGLCRDLLPNTTFDGKAMYKRCAVDAMPSERYLCSSAAVLLRCQCDAVVAVRFAALLWRCRIQKSAEHDTCEGGQGERWLIHVTGSHW